MSPREYCLECRRASRVCLCSQIISEECEIEVVILQHPEERRVAIGTAWLAHKCLKNSKIFRAVHFEELREFNTWRETKDLSEAVVLFPTQDASFADSSMPLPKVLFVLDGTWSNVRVLWRENKFLHKLTAVKLPLESPSEYRIRKAPKPEYISTIEAIDRCLSLLGVGGNYTLNLHRVFDAMVENQLTFIPPNYRKIKGFKKQ